MTTRLLLSFFIFTAVSCSSINTDTLTEIFGIDDFPRQGEIISKNKTNYLGKKYTLIGFKTSQKEYKEFLNSIKIPIDHKLSEKELLDFYKTSEYFKKNCECISYKHEKFYVMSVYSFDESKLFFYIDEN